MMQHFGSFEMTQALYLCREEIAASLAEALFKSRRTTSAYCSDKTAKKIGQEYGHVQCGHDMTRKRKSKGSCCQSIFCLVITPYKSYNFVWLVSSEF